MISVVNGYICTSSCEVAAAKQGKDPAVPPGSAPGTSSKKDSGFDRMPAIMLGGALKGIASTDAATAASTSQSAVAQQKVNLLA